MQLHRPIYYLSWCSEILRTFHYLGNKSTLWNDWMDSISQYHHLMWHHSHFLLKTCSHAEQLPALQSSLRHVFAKFWGEACAQYCLKLVMQQLTLGNVTGTWATNSVIDFWRKARTYLTTHWLEGHNLTLEMHCYEGMSQEAHQGRHLTTTLELFRNHRTTTDSPNTTKKQCVFSFSNCHHQWLKWPNLNH